MGDGLKDARSTGVLATAVLFAGASVLMEAGPLTFHPPSTSPARFPAALPMGALGVEEY